MRDVSYTFQPAFSVRLVSGEQAFDEVARVEDCHVFGALAGADEQDREAQLIRYAQDDAALRRPVEFGEEHALRSAYPLRRRGSV